MVKDFIDSNEHKTMVLPDRLMINQCFYYFKTLYKNMEKKKGGAPISGMKAIEDDTRSTTTAKESGPNPQQEQEIGRLNMLVKQRDNEIGILLNYLNKKKEGSAVQGVSDISVQRSNGFASPGMDTTQASASKAPEE
mgnify:FL=1